MNTDTGEIYRDMLAQEAARARGETVVPVSERVADAVEIGMEAINRAERRAEKFKKNGRRVKQGV